MEPNLISKKELLDEKGISYGQLYRWKRKQLIPEEWFIRKSTFTGQETFFPRDLILPRIDKIMNGKDDLSLDELADQLSPVLPQYELRKMDFAKRNIVSRVVVETFAADDADSVVYSFEKLLYLFVVDKLLQAGEMSLEEGERLLQTLKQFFPKFEGKPCDLIFIRKMGVSSFVLSSSTADIYFETGVKLIARLSMAECVEQLKGKLA
ncbi:YhbD family protein [Cohnella soli]|uniref:YhbD family protein n=1 Tax=Cohnella soli TaxID=425005 RepID=A0ABW0HV99_9BACL